MYEIHEIYQVYDFNKDSPVRLPGGRQGIVATICQLLIIAFYKIPLLRGGTERSDVTGCFIYSYDHKCTDEVSDITRTLNLHSIIFITFSKCSGLSALVEPSILNEPLLEHELYERYEFYDTHLFRDTTPRRLITLASTSFREGILPKQSIPKRFCFFWFFWWPVY